MLYGPGISRNPTPLPIYEQFMNFGLEYGNTRDRAPRRMAGQQECLATTRGARMCRRSAGQAWPAREDGRAIHTKRTNTPATVSISPFSDSVFGD